MNKGISEIILIVPISYHVYNIFLMVSKNNFDLAFLVFIFESGSLIGLNDNEFVFIRALADEVDPMLPDVSDVMFSGGCFRKKFGFTGTVFFPVLTAWIIVMMGVTAWRQKKVHVIEEHEVCPET
jgi:hypothetical protein